MHTTLPSDLLPFILTLAFSFLLGLEQRKHHSREEQEDISFGTDRTFTLIGILGFVLYILDRPGWTLFLAGGIFLGLLLAVFYGLRVYLLRKFGITTLLTAMITYCMAPLIFLAPYWLSIGILVCVLILTEVKQNLAAFTRLLDEKEFITLALFLVLAGVILPLVPDRIYWQALPVSPYHFWLAIVVVSGISYISYLLQKFVFPGGGILLTGLLGGLYSSTATTVILARKSRELSSESHQDIPAIFLATAMMYLRIFLLSLLFFPRVASQLAPSFLILLVLNTGIVFLFQIRAGRKKPEGSTQQIPARSNPLELKVAFLFAVLFILFGLLTTWVVRTQGSAGIFPLSLVVGFTDIDPFILNLLQGNYHLAETLIAAAILNASTSNNLLKMGYAVFLGDKKIRFSLVAGFLILILAGILLSLLLFRTPGG